MTNDNLVRGRKAYTPQNLSPLDPVYAKWLKENKEVRVSAANIRAVLFYQKEFRASEEYKAAKPVSNAEAKREARKERLRAQLAELEGEGTEDAPAKPTRKRKAKAAPEPEPEVDPEEEETEETEETEDEHVDPEADEVEEEPAPKPTRKRPVRAKTAGRKVSF